jgi:hypothetical protein
MNENNCLTPRISNVVGSLFDDDKGRRFLAFLNFNVSGNSKPSLTGANLLGKSSLRTDKKLNSCLIGVFL